MVGPSSLRNDPVKGLDAMQHDATTAITPTRAQINFLQALAVDPRNGNAFRNLGMTLDHSSSVVLVDGKQWTKRELFMESVKLDPSCGMSYQTLALDLRIHETVNLLGAVWTKKALLERAIMLDPMNAHAYNNLGATLARGAWVDLGEVGSIDAAGLFTKAILLQPKLAEAYANLGGVLGTDDKIQLASALWDRQQLLIEAIRLDSSISRAFNSLGLTLGDDSSATVQLPSGIMWSKKDLHVQAIDLDPSAIAAWNGLADTMGAAEEVRLLDGSTWTRRQLRAKVLTMERWAWKADDKLTKDRWALREVDLKPTTESRPVPTATRRR